MGSRRYSCPERGYRANFTKMEALRDHLDWHISETSRPRPHSRRSTKRKSRKYPPSPSHHQGSQDSQKIIDLRSVSPDSIHITSSEPRTPSLSPPGDSLPSSQGSILLTPCSSQARITSPPGCLQPKRPRWAVKPASPPQLPVDQSSESDSEAGENSDDAIDPVISQDFSNQVYELDSSSNEYTASGYGSDFDADQDSPFKDLVSGMPGYHSSPERPKSRQLAFPSASVLEEPSEVSEDEETRTESSLPETPITPTTPGKSKSSMEVNMRFNAFLPFIQAADELVREHDRRTGGATSDDDAETVEGQKLSEEGEDGEERSGQEKRLSTELPPKGISTTVTSLPSSGANRLDAFSLPSHTAKTTADIATQTPPPRTSSPSFKSSILCNFASALHAIAHSCDPAEQNCKWDGH